MKELHEKRYSRRFCKWAAVCAACLLFLATGMTSLAARTGNVRIDSVNVRSEASTEAGRVCQLPINTTVNVVEEQTGSDGKVWYSVTFTLDGAEKAGWIRSDMLTVTETEDNEGEISTGGSEAYTIQEPIESYEASEALIETTISVGDQEVTAWQVNTELTGGQDLYLVSAEKADGSIGWFYYDPDEETFQRDLGQFAGSAEEEPEGLIQALQSELTGLKESSAKQLSMRLYIIIALAVVCVILLVLTIVFGLKARNADYEYYDDDEEDEEEEEDDYEEEVPAVKRRGLFCRREEDEEEEEDDFDDFLAAVKKKQEEPEADLEEEISEEESLEEADLEETAAESTAKFATADLPEIDMSAVLEIEEAAQKEQQESVSVQPEVQETSDEEDGLDDFDIQILDWEDLGL